jgi:Tol biopolymer transport system component
MSIRPFRPAVLLIAALALLGSGCADPPSSQESAAGDSIAATAPGTDIYVAPLDTTGEMLSMGTPRPVTTQLGYDNQPTFLLDGSGLVWTAIRDGQADVYRSGDDGGTRLTRTPESEFSPTPRPNDRMTVVRVEADGRQRLWTYRLDGTPVEPVLPDADSVGYHAWLDSSRVALFVLGTPPTLHVADRTAGTDTVVATRIGRSLQPVPGGTDVSFVQVGPDSTTAIHVLDGETLTTRRLAATPGRGTGNFHTWTPGGHVLMATDGALQAWHPERDGWRVVADLDTMSVSRLAVSPSGDRLAFVAAE